MKASIRIADVYCEILEESKKKLVIVKNHKTYVGALFFEKDPWEKVKKVYDRVDIDGTAVDILVEAYELLKAHGMLTKDTLQTMAHWQYVNGLTDEMITDGYGCKDDEELLNIFKEKRTA